ncbi:hypothetical protein HMPREF3213_01739 [Heyndrickxia coagulans]|uniref:Uncharacterized protein n=1 Tax=Heyndrickxia coagulans TaxID=1398 RepID=A0A133KSR1_HEYCO|nr:hypothetical protein HMPREF3213_01739 [Heyndrickxia coagulans]
MTRGILFDRHYRTDPVQLCAGCCGLVRILLMCNCNISILEIYACCFLSLC